MSAATKEGTGVRASRWAERREDYALRRVPASYRQWGVLSLAGVALGVATAMFFLAWGGELVLGYGTGTTLAAMIIGTALIGSIGYVLTRISAATGLDADLITRGAGFGFLGSAYTSLIYTFNFILFFAFEGQIMAAAIHSYWPAVPQSLIFVLIGLVFVPLTWWGITAMNWLMWVTAPIYLAFLGWTIHLAASSHGPAFWSYVPKSVASPSAGPALLQVLASVLSLISMAAASADIGRFLPTRKRTAGAFALGYVTMIVTLCILTMLGGWLTLRFADSTNPGDYLAVRMGVWGVIFVMVTQIRINTTNVYSGSLAFANFFCRVFHFAPGRQYWVVLTSAAGTALMFGNILGHLTQALTFEGTFITAWLFAVVSDIAINKKLFKLSPLNFVYKRAHTYRYNPVGVGALALALAVSLPLAFGADGDFGKTLAPFLSGAIAFVAAPLLALATRGRYYLPKTSAHNIDPALPEVGTGDVDSVIALERADRETVTDTCVACRRDFELAEFVACPFHKGSLCSVCCSSEASCGEICKSPQTLAAQK